MYRYYWCQLNCLTGELEEGSNRTSLDTMTDYIEFIDFRIWTESRTSKEHARQLVQDKVLELSQLFSTLLNKTWDLK